MSETPPQHKRRVSLTKAQLQTDLGAELLSLCESVTADGKVAPEEAQGLQEWLDDAAAADLPAASYLREVVGRVLADGKITPEECREVYRAVETVLPPEVRREAKASRRDAETAERADAQAIRDKARDERRRNAQIAYANFMVAGVLHDGRAAVIERFAKVGDPVRLVRDSNNRYSRFAVAVLLKNGTQIGFVPEEDAQRLAPFLDRGARCLANLTKILDGRCAPIPVVEARLFRADSTVDAEQIPRASRSGVVNLEGSSRDVEPPRSKRHVPMSVWWLAGIIGIGILILILLFVES